MFERIIIVASVLVFCTSANAGTSPLPFALDRVRVTGGVFKEKQDIDKEYLLEFMTMERTDRLLAEFRRVAGLPAKAVRYPGRWEGGGINGHILGHYLTALSACYAATGDERAKERADYIVEELAACQTANGDGYVMTIPQDKVWDRVRNGTFTARSFDICGWWVPNYTIHKVFAGLRDAYRWTGNAKALEVERKLGDWYAKMIENLSRDQMGRLMRSEWGGLNETFADLYRDTGDEKFLKIAKEKFNDGFFGPLREGKDMMDRNHANTQMPKVVGLASIYDITHDEADKKAVMTFWDSVVNRRTLANGGHSDHEHFYNVKDHAKHLGPQTFETCNINNMHKLSSRVFCWRPDSGIADFVERSLINQLVAQHGEKPGEFGYFLSTMPVATKVFSTPEGAWWCCVGTGMENPMRYGEQVYFHDDEGVWVNLYMASALCWKEKGVKIEQVTDYPDESRAKIVVSTERPVRFALRLRKPAWCDTMLVDGEVAVADETGYVVADREWKNGDSINVELLAAPRIEYLPGSGERFAAFMAGPKLMVGINDVKDAKNDPAKRRWDDHLAAPAGTDEPAKILVKEDLDNAEMWKYALSNNQYPMAFGIRFMPLHKVYEEHYTMYFPVMPRAEWEARHKDLEREAADAAVEKARIIDQVEPGFQQSEVNHDYRGEEDDTGEFRNRKFRSGGKRGWFEYTVEVDGERPMELVIVVLQDTCPIFVDGVKIYDGERIEEREFFDLSIALPLKATLGKSKVTLRFGSGGGIYSLLVRRQIQASRP